MDELKRFVIEGIEDRLQLIGRALNEMELSTVSFQDLTKIKNQFDALMISVAHAVLDREVTFKEPE